MNPQALPPSPLDGLRTAEMGEGDAPRLQRLFEANVDFFRIVHGAPAGPDEARRTLAEGPPAQQRFERHWRIGYVDDAGGLAAYADVVTGLLHPSVLHVGLFVVAAGRHGRGDAQALVGGLEDWARAAGAEWVRLGVVAGNLRAERFWTRQGFVQTRTRVNIRSGSSGNDVVRVLFKPLAGGTKAEYLALVERDRPETP
jgi:GNAT superfamily N-acetyltransferase